MSRLSKEILRYSALIALGATCLQAQAQIFGAATCTNPGGADGFVLMVAATWATTQADLDAATELGVRARFVQAGGPTVQTEWYYDLPDEAPSAVYYSYTGGGQAGLYAIDLGNHRWTEAGSGHTDILSDTYCYVFKPYGY